MGDAEKRSSSRGWTIAKDVLLVGVVLAITTMVAFAFTLVSQPTPSSSFDVSVTVNPSSASIAPGGSASMDVTATLTSGSSRQVQFSCSNLPDGTSCTFTPPSCGPPCTAGVVLSSSPNTPVGTYAMVILASTDTISRTVGFTLTVTAPPPPQCSDGIDNDGDGLIDFPADPGCTDAQDDQETDPPPPPPAFNFSLEVDPTNSSVAPGGAASANVTATLTSGTTRNVQFSCTNLSSEITCTFSPRSCSPTCTAVLSLATTNHTAEGVYSVNVTASNGLVSRTTAYSLKVANVTSSTTLTFQEGDGGAHSRTDDAYITNGTPNENHASGPLLLVDGEGCIFNVSEICRSLLKFPDFIGPAPGQVPPNASIVSASLTLNVTNEGPPDMSQILYQITEAWNVTNVTWNAFATPGMPGSTGPSIFFESPFGPVTVNITGIVQNWVHGDANEGVFLWTHALNGTHYQSSDSSDRAGRPQLTVTFRPPPLVRGQSTESVRDLPSSPGSTVSPTLPSSGFERLGADRVSWLAAVLIPVASGAFRVRRRRDPPGRARGLPAVEFEESRSGTVRTSPPFSPRDSKT